MRLSRMFVFLFVFCMISNPFSMVYAYLDPGSGSMLLQLLLGGVAGVVVVFKLYWERLKSFLNRRDTNEQPPPTND